jgi:hypothetical protein
VRRPKMKSAKELVGKIIIVAIVLAIIFFVVKGMTIEVWKSPNDNAQAYSILGEDGREMCMYFMPNNETLFFYIEDDFYEIVLAKMKGTYGTHYFGNLWRIGNSDSIFGLRMYEKDIKPVYMEIKILSKYFEGSGESTFAENGETTYSIIQFGNNAINFSGMWLQKINTDNILVEDLLSQVQ